MTTPATHEPVSSSVALQAIVDEIAVQLGETEEEPRRQIKRAVRVLGEERTRSLVAQTLEIEAAGGLMLPNESRRRTPGGVFFHLMRANIEHKEWYRIFRPQTTGHDKGTSGAGKAPTMGATPFDWTTFGAIATEAMSSAGEATTVKLTVIGRPGKIVERGDVALVAMRSEKAPSLPKGVPAPPSPQTDYMVLVGMKQWRKVAEALAADPADKLLIEGYPTVQPDVAGIMVYATSATTTGIQAGKRAAQTTPTS